MLRLDFATYAVSKVATGCTCGGVPLCTVAPLRCRADHTAIVARADGTQKHVSFGSKAHYSSSRISDELSDGSETLGSADSNVSAALLGGRSNFGLTTSRLHKFAPSIRL